ncbi:N-acetyltransferase ESCO1 [Zootermopsis nevadensis]|uniref:N-acetyltransferase ESCO1 n=2 Tax=Zootermopsis nevadensis TaxID=136037 RepID=A0A067RNT1_ZOONE|nr:N-acetyltransferase ESCO1 [Zootermopsis nevadensis]
MEPTPPSSPPPDPAKKFFKTQRTLKINTSATVTLEKNIKLKVSNGKFSLCKPVTKSKSCRMPKADISKYCLNKNNGIFTEKSTTEIVQETVHDNVEILLKNLEESPKKDNLPAVGDLQSPNHHIYAITTSTLSLAIDDGLPHQPLLQTAQTLSNPSSGSTFVASTAKIDSENMQKSQEEFLFAGENFTEHNAEKENGNKYYPVFYKTSANKLADLTNVKSLRGNKQSWRSIGDYQYIIDAGQKKFGATQCKECGIVYQIGDPDDEVFHQKYHNNGHDLKYTSWKHERVVAYYGSERVILIKPSDPKSWLNKVQNVLAIVDKELGYADSALEGLSNSQVYLYVMDKQVTGCVVAHQISFAFKMLNSVIEGCDCCSEESYPAKCGISRVWVAKNHRRKKIASRIMDCLRSSFIHGYMLGMDEFAFSAPTIDGKAFAEKYTGTMNYLVYS